MGASEAAYVLRKRANMQKVRRACAEAARACFLEQRNALGLSGVSAWWIRCLFEKAIPSGPAHTSDVSSGTATVVGRSHAAK